MACPPGNVAFLLCLPLDFGNEAKIFNHHFPSSGHVPLTNVTLSGAVIAIEPVWPVTSSAVETSKTFVISMLACGTVSGCWKKMIKKN